MINPGYFVEQAGYGNIAAPRLFATRFVWASYALALTGFAPDREVKAEISLWAWLTLVYFDQVCPPTAGVRDLGQRTRYVPTGSVYRTYYRHLLAGPWQILIGLRNNPERARAILGGAMHTPGELYEQVASHMELTISTTVLSLSNTSIACGVPAPSKLPRTGT